MIISASRRTDIPCCYSQWFVNRLREGYALIPNPRNPGRLGRVALSPEQVDCIVFWTKNPAPMLELLPGVEKLGYSYYFQFTITAYGRDMERNLPEKTAVIDTFKRLSDRIGPKRVDWRFDPIITNDRFSAEWVAERFGWLCGELREYTERCIISFVDAYSHTKNKGDVLNRSEMLETAGMLSHIAKELKLPIYACSEEINLKALGVQPASCIDKGKIEEIIGCRIEAKKDIGQRPACGCIESVDIGAYDTCDNGCLYCYATTSEKTVHKRREGHRSELPLLTGAPKGSEIVTDRTGGSLKIGQTSFLDE
ncbi:DUF1848 domain-containing protein [Anoxybacterium hadale]|uniref:DUF1848 domain-containing protein n=1 Tax=Anoxybacterium hadale TaxID=3408580 RepID=A0ACD1AB81_9FIRM|nr:DUF1848 domain-containing protein [Clostridiales bacterium]